MIDHSQIYRRPHETIQFNISTALAAFILFFLLFALNIQAQQGVQQRFFTSQNGLKISWVHNITQSENNTFIIGHGAVSYLTKYDGYNFNYLASPQKTILGKVYESTNGSLWSLDSADQSHIRYYANNEWQTIQLNAGIPFLPTPGASNKLLFIRDGALREFDKTKQQTRIIKQADESQIGLFIDMTTFQDGSVWITGENGVAKYIAQCDTCDIQEQWIDFQVPKSLGLSHFYMPFEGDEGELTLMAKSSELQQNVLVGINGQQWQKLYTSEEEEVYCGWRGHDESLWIIKGSLPPLNGPLRDWNLFFVQKDQETKIGENRVLNNVLNDLIVEPNGQFWLATGSGLAHFTPALWRRQLTGIDLNQGYKRIHEDSKGRLWAAGADDFLFFSNEKWESQQFTPAVYTGDISSLKNGLMLVGISGSGLALFNPEDKSCTVTYPFGEELVRYYDQDKNGNCFIILQNLEGTSRLISYDGEQIRNLAEDLKIINLAPGECEVTDIIQTQNGDIWITTFTDVIVYKKGIRTNFDLKTEFEWGLSTSALELKNGHIWISGSNGIVQYNGESWSLVQSPEFETARMMRITKDGSIWVASGTGIHRLIDGIWISNSYEDGLPNSLVSDIFEDQQGTIWACTNSGMYCYYPEADTDTPQTTVPSDMNSSQGLSSGEMQFVFKGYDKWEYTTNDRLLYSYRFDNDSWSPFENKTIIKVDGLSAGPHVFEVKAMDRNGMVDPTPAVWPFKVLPPWYRQPFSITLLAVFIGLIILSIVFAIIRHLRIEKLVQSRTAELEKTKEKAESSDRLKSAFLANMSHEIRTPMNGILGFTELLKEPDLTGEDQKRFIEMIEKGGIRLLGIITDIINISKVESGQMEVAFSASNVNEQIEYIFNFFKPETDLKGIQLIYKSSLPYNEATITTDTEKLYAILTNLVKNAIKYTSKGSIEFGYEKKEDFLEFFVKDTGVGIVENRQEAIFERFIQADVLNKMALQGAGLGLSISKAYAEMLGGKIWVKSEIDKGSTFYFTIPYTSDAQIVDLQ